MRERWTFALLILERSSLLAYVWMSLIYVSSGTRHRVALEAIALAGVFIICSSARRYMATRSYGTVKHS